MKKLIAIVFIAALVAGCATFPKGDNLKFIVQSLSLIGTAEAIKHDSKTKKPFELTAKSLDALIAAGSADPVALQNALTNLPVSEFKGPEGQILVAEGAIVITWLTGQLQLESKTNVNLYVSPISRGLRDGIKQGLALNP